MKRLLLFIFQLFPAFGFAAGVTEQVGELTRKYSNALVLIRDEGGAGSGFVAKIGDRKCLITNQHVLAGTIRPTFTFPNQKRLRIGSAAAAVDHDIIACGVADDADAMEVMSGVDQGVTVGDEVAVLGNPDGSGVIHPLLGQIVGIGPNLVEISAQFVPGNSGSPVVHLRTGKVIAIATYLRIEKADFEKGRMVDEVRRFCYRLDSIQKWEPVRWGDFHDDDATIQKLRRRTYEICGLLLNAKRVQSIDSNSLKDSDVRASLVKYQKGIATARDYKEASAIGETFTKDLRRLATLDLEFARRRISYDYFAKALVREEALREPFPRVLDRILAMRPQSEAELAAGSTRQR